MNSEKKKVLILTYTDVRRDPIVRNQINWLLEVYELNVVCNIPLNKEGVKFIKYPAQSFIQRNLRTLLLVMRLFNVYTWSKAHKKLTADLSGKGYELIIVHHIKLLPIALSVTPKAKILFYAHEYYTGMYDHSLLWRMLFKNYFIWIAKKYIHKCDYLITVCESIKEIYEKEYNIKADFIHNTAGYFKITPSAVDPKHIKMIHHGLASTSRKLELMISLMNYLDNRFTLTIILQTNSIINDLYIKKLKRLAGDNPRIVFREMVEYDEVVNMGNEYDIGLFIMPPTTTNEIFSLGHKVFQYIQSRLMLVISPLPEMKKIVDKYNLGIYQEDYNIRKLAEKMRRLTAEDIYYYKCQADKHAADLSSDTGMKKLLNIVSNLLCSKLNSGV